MKKNILMSLILILSILNATVAFAKPMILSYNGANHGYSGIIYNLEINGEPISTDVPPVDMDDITFIPVRAVFEKLGATLEWSVAEQKMSVVFGNYKIEFKSNDKNAKINGETLQMATAAKKINERLLVPADFVKDNLNINIEVFPDDELITINTSVMQDNISFSTDGKNDEVSISLEGYNSYNIMRITDPNRIVIDLSSTAAQDEDKSIPVNGKIVKNIRYAKFDKETTRIVLDVIGQPMYQVEEKDGYLNLHIQTSTLKNLTYSDSGDRVYFSLKGAKLTQGGENLKKFFTGKYDVTGKKYTITFSSKLANLGTGLMQINDKLLNSVQISSDSASNQTSITFKAKDKFVYEIITRPDVNDTAITILKPASTKDKLIVIDPGHGGVEAGAVYGGICEKEFNLDIALRLNNILKSNNVKTYITREDDSFVGLYERAYIANSLNAALFLCIHNNAMDNTQKNFQNVKGTETLYFPPGKITGVFTSKRFAQIIQDKLIGTLKTTNRGMVERPNLVVLKATKMPAILTEIGFMTNKNDMDNLKNPAFRQKTAEALAESVIQAVKEMK